MTIKEAAHSLIEEFSPHAQYWDCYNDEPLEEPHAVHCAIICCKRIIKELPFEVSIGEFETISCKNPSIEFWSKVLKELKKYVNTSRKS